jgi:hypothetical protein
MSPYDHETMRALDLLGRRAGRPAGRPVPRPDDNGARLLVAAFWSDSDSERARGRVVNAHAVSCIGRQVSLIGPGPAVFFALAS